MCVSEKVLKTTIAIAVWLLSVSACNNFKTTRKLRLQLRTSYFEVVYWPSLDHANFFYVAPLEILLALHQRLLVAFRNVTGSNVCFLRCASTHVRTKGSKVMSVVPASTSSFCSPILVELWDQKDFHRFEVHKDIDSLLPTFTRNFIFISGYYFRRI